MQKIARPFFARFRGWNDAEHLEFQTIIALYPPPEAIREMKMRSHGAGLPGAFSSAGAFQSNASPFSADLQAMERTRGRNRPCGDSAETRAIEQSLHIHTFQDVSGAPDGSGRRDVQNRSHRLWYTSRMMDHECSPGRGICIGSVLHSHS